MKAFIRNEIKLFWDRKNKTVCVMGILAVVLTFYFQYVPAFQNYPEEVFEELNENTKDIAIWLSYYENREIVLSGKGATSLKLGEEYAGLEMEPFLTGFEEQQMETEQISVELAETELLLNVWKQYEQTNIRLMYYWGGMADEKSIRAAMIREDENLAAIEEIGEEVAYTNVFRGTFEDWKKRMLLHEAYEAAGVEEPVCPIVPSGLYLLKEAFSGSSLVSLIFIVMIVLFHFDCWANEFENHTYCILYTLPVKKEQVYVMRFIIRMLCSVFSIGIAASILFLLGTGYYGVGNEVLLAVTDGITSFAVPIRSIVAKEILFSLLYLGFLTACILVISFLVKTRMNTLMLSAVLCMTGIMYVTSYNRSTAAVTMADCMNPFQLLRFEEIAMGDIAIDEKYLLFLPVYMTIFLMIGILAIHARED